jgi:hypothetical protein
MARNGNGDGDTVAEPGNIREHLGPQETLSRDQTEALIGAIKESIEKREEILSQQAESHKQLGQRTAGEESAFLEAAETIANSGALSQNEQTSAVDSEQGERSRYPEAEALYRSMMVAGAVLAGLGAVISLIWGSIVPAIGFVPALGFFLYAAQHGLS